MSSFYNDNDLTINPQSNVHCPSYIAGGGRGWDVVKSSLFIQHQRKVNKSVEGVDCLQINSYLPVSGHALIALMARGCHPDELVICNSTQRQRWIRQAEDRERFLHFS